MDETPVGLELRYATTVADLPATETSCRTSQFPGLDS
jgi:hypothetical protein